LERETIRWPGFYPEWAMPTSKMAELVILAFALVIIFPYLPGSDSPAFKGVSIFLGVLFSLGSTSAVANVIAGVILTYTRAFRIGDRVQIADTVGDVIAKTLLATQVRTIKNVVITVPNSLVLGSHIINFSTSANGRGLILHATVTIGYDAPWRQIHALLIAAAEATSDILNEPRPFVLQTSLDDFYVSYQINAFTDQPGKMAAIYSGLYQNIQDKFNEAGVEIMSPHYAAVRDGNSTAIPETYLPANYKPPGFRLWNGS
jgi:small-conductance mechanosensitive channel